LIHLSTIDFTLILIYFGIVLYVGFRSARKTKSSEEDFLLAGRTITLPVFVMTLVSTWYGGILGVGEFSYRYGISNWVTQGLPYYFFAAIFAFFLAKKVRATNLFSIPDKLEVAYDRKTALLGSGLTFILMLPAPYILMLSVFLQMMFGWSLLVSLVVTAVVTVSYMYVGGFHSDIATDIVEFIFMFAGFAVILPFCVVQFGGWEYLQSHLPPLHTTWHGGNSWQYIMVWFFIALWTLVDPAFHQRCLAAKDGATAQKGILVSILFWFIFDFLTATAGLYSRAALPHLADPMMAYPMLAETVLPPVAKGLFYIGMLATIMSTLNTLSFVSAQTLGRDIAMRCGIGHRRHENKERKEGNRITHFAHLISDSLFPKPQTPDQKHSSVSLTRLGLIVSFLFSVLFGLYMPSVIKMWYTIGTIVIPGLLVPLMASYFQRLSIPANYAFTSMLLGWLTSLLWLIAGGSGGIYPLGIEPMYPGLGVAVLIWGIGKIQAPVPND